MHTLFLLNPAAGKADCTRTLPQQIAAAAAGAGLAPEDVFILGFRLSRIFCRQTMWPARCLS